MALFFPILFWIVIFKWRWFRFACWRTAFLEATLVCGLACWGWTELLSLFNAINVRWLSLAWGTTLLAALVILKPWRIPRPVPDSAPVPWSHYERILLVGLLALGGFISLIALSGPPNSWDAMIYHLPRVVHWAENQSIAPFPTHVSRQLYATPFQNYIVLHIYVFSGIEIFFNFPQYLFYVGTGIAVSLLARQLGGTRLTQLLAAILCLTYAPAVLLSYNVMTDLGVVFWFCCGIFFTLRPILSSEGTYWPSILMGGAALGLAFATKSVSFTNAPAFAIILLTLAVRRLGWKAMAPLVVSGMISIALVAPHLYRNIQVFMNPVGPEIDRTMMENSPPSAKAAISNSIRYISDQMAVPINQVNDLNEGLVRYIHTLLGMDVNDPNTTVCYYTYEVYFLRPNEGSNFFTIIHLGLFLICLPWMAFPGFFRKFPVAGALLLGSTATFFFHFALCKICIGQNRYLFSTTMIALTVLALFLTQRLRERAVMILGLFLLGFAFYTALQNTIRPLPITHRKNCFTMEHDRLYFVARPQYYDSFLKVATWLEENHVNEYGLACNDDGFVYPLWSMTKERLGHAPKISYIGLTCRDLTFGRNPVELPRVLIVLTYDNSAFRDALIEDTETLESTEGIVYRRVVDGIFARVYIKELK